jgi:PAS domain S-box-containing protein
LNTYKSSKESIVESSFDQLGELIIFSDDDLMKIGKAWSGEPQKFEWHCKPTNGDNIPLEMILHPGTYFGKEVIIASGRNISERIEYETIMKESESRFRTLASHAPIGIFLTNKKGNAIYVNDKLKEIAHYPSVDGFMENWLSKIHPKDQKGIKSRIDITKKDNHQQYEYRIVPKKGNTRWVKVQVNLLRDTNDEITGRVGTIEDITQEIKSAKIAKEAEKDKLRAEFAEETTRKLQKEINERIAAEEELQSAKQLNQYIIDSSTDMIIATDIKGRITEFNQAATEGFGYTSSKIIDTSVDPLFANNLNREEILVRVLKDGKWSGEVLCKRADESTFMSYLSASILSGPEKEAIGTMGVLRDITEIKKAEKELRDNIHQKEILLKEVHHRVKNNLQVISSILNLQTGYVNDEDTLDVIRECQDRIKSMAFIHESLYQKEEFAAVNFTEYLHNLCNNILYSYITPNRNIKMDFDIEDISLSLDSAIPCGLIVNELVSNCFKYAFKGLKHGSIKIILTKNKYNNKCLIVHDSGKGLPNNLDIKTNDSLGLQLVWMLVDQIDGEIKYEYASGSKFIVNFKRD